VVWAGIGLVLAWRSERLARAALGALPLVFMGYGMLLQAPLLGRATILSGLDDWLIYESSARDILLNGLVRYRAAAMPRLSLIGGGGYAWMRTSEDPVQGSRPVLWWHGLTLTAGMDIAIVDASHAALAPSFRVRWIDRPDALDGWNGLGAFTFQVGATVIVR